MSIFSVNIPKAITIMHKIELSEKLDKQVDRFLDALSSDGMSQEDKDALQGQLAAEKALLDQANAADGKPVT